MHCKPWCCNVHISSLINSFIRQNQLPCQEKSLPLVPLEGSTKGQIVVTIGDGTPETIFTNVSSDHVWCFFVFILILRAVSFDSLLVTETAWTPWLLTCVLLVLRAFCYTWYTLYLIHIICGDVWWTIIISKVFIQTAIGHYNVKDKRVQAISKLY